MNTALVGSLLASLFWGVVVGLLAKRKNRSAWGWGVAGVFSWVAALIVLAFLPYRCPACDRSLTNEQGRLDMCPSCGSIPQAMQRAERAEQTEWAEQPSTMTSTVPAGSAQRDVPTPRTEVKLTGAAASTEKLWADALAEFEGSSRRPGLWARLFAEAGGNESAAKAEYLKARVAEMNEAPVDFLTALRRKGYRVEMVADRWTVADPSGIGARYFETLTELEREAPFLMERELSA